MSNSLICYFSASGKTKEVANKIKEAIDGDIFEIEPKNKYTDEDLDWTNKQSRSSLEMNDKSSRPEINKRINNLDLYQNIIIGFPIWWYTAPTIINTFIEENDLSNKNIYVFVTSGGSNEVKSFNDLKEKYNNLNWIKAIRFTGNENINEYSEWLNNN